MNLSELLNQAYTCHEQGDLTQAEKLYQQVMVLQPPDAHIYYNLSLVFQSQERWSEAIDSLQSAVRLTPQDTSLYQELGALWAKIGEREKARECFEAVVQQAPQQAGGYHNLGAILDELKQPKAALDAYHKALELEPNRAETCFNLGNLYQKIDQLPEAIAHYQKALSLNPDMVMVTQNLGNLYQAQGQYEQAIELYQTALEHHPEAYKLYNNLGSVYREQHKLSSARACFEKCLHIKPDYLKAQINLADILQESGDILGAESRFKAILKQSPQEESIHMKLAVLYYREGLYEQTIAHCQAAIADDPKDYIAYSNLGSSIKVKGLIQESLDAFYQAIAIKPDFWSAYENLLFTLHNLPGLTAPHFITEAQTYGQALSQTFPPLADHWLVKPEPQTRLRIGYISPDFREHAANYMIQSIFEHQDRENFEIICFAHTDPADSFTLRYYEQADEWHFLNGLSETEVARLIYHSKVHILLDLGSGHTANNPLAIMAQQPAPVQFTLWPVSTGVPGINYFVSDQYLITPAEKALSPEHIMVRQGSFLCLMPPQGAPAVAPAPCLKNGFITFGSFNNLAKVNPEVVSLWAQILNAVPNSHLFLKFKAFADPGICTYFTEAFGQYGIAPERLRLSAWTDSSQHYSLYHEIDIALDPFPFNGHTTTCEALWMGVPVVSLIGEFGFGRAGLSILSAAGFSQWAAASPTAYVQLAEQLSQDPQRLSALRPHIRHTLTNSNLFNSAAYTKELEHFYRQAWQQWCAKQLSTNVNPMVPFTSPVPHPQQARQYNTLGTLMAQSNQPQKAAVLFERALQADPQYHAAYNNLGALWAAQGEIEKAQACYESALHHEPHLSDIRFNLGNLYLLQGQWEQAVSHYEQVILQSPLFTDAYLNLGNALRQLGQHSRASAYYQLILRIAPENVLAWVNLGSLYLEQHQYNQARDCLENALRLEPHHASAQRYLAQIEAFAPAGL